MKSFFGAVILVLLLANAQAGVETGITNAGITSIFQPVFAEDTSAAKKILILRQEIRVDVFQGYVTVRADYWFNNTADENVMMLTGLPSCYDKESDCTNYYRLRIMMNNGVPNTAVLSSVDSIERASGKKVLQANINTWWQTWNTTFQPGVTEVTLNYGIATSSSLNANGSAVHGNAFIYRFSNYSWWGAGANQGDIWFRMNGGYVTKDILGLLPDKKFLAGNSIVHASLDDVMNDSTYEVLMWYRDLDSARTEPSHVSWDMQFYKVNAWKVNEKLLATLAPFSATDFEGKAFNKEVDDAVSLLRFSYLLGAVMVVLLLGIFIYFSRRSAP